MTKAEWLKAYDRTEYWMTEGQYAAMVRDKAPLSWGINQPLVVTNPFDRDRGNRRMGERCMLLAHDWGLTYWWEDDVRSSEVRDWRDRIPVRISDHSPHPPAELEF